MRLGKLDNDRLEALVLSKFRKTRPESLGAPQIGVDCATLDMGGDLIELSTDPITSAKLTHLGRLSVHVSCNDAAASGAEPVGLLVTLLAPPYATEKDIGQIADDLAAAARDANVDILGGHTEVTDAVTRFVTNTTVIARIDRTRTLPGPSAGDALVMTKWAALEASTIIAGDYPERISSLGKGVLDAALSFSGLLSVVAEGRIAMDNGATAMHDVTEGGVLGAAWEMAYVSGLGVVVDTEKIPVKPETKAICDLLGLDVHRLISSGSLLIACRDGEKMCSALAEKGVPATVIGFLTDSGMHLPDGTKIEPPAADEIYKLF